MKKVAQVVALFFFSSQVADCLALQKSTSPASKAEQQVNGATNEFVNIGGREYLIKLTSLTWPDCRDECAALNMSLISFQEPDEYMTVLKGLQELGFDKFWYWTNGFRKANATAWTWLPKDEDVVSDFYWAPRQPSEDNSQDSCISFNVQEGGWDDEFCDAVYYLSYICE